MTPTDEVDVFFSPTVTLIGIDATTCLPERIQTLQISKPLIVTDKGIIQSGILKKLTDSLEYIGIEYIVYDNVIPNPTDNNVAQGADIYNTQNCNGLISVGGGSSHDCCKGIGIIVTHGGTIQQYEGENKLSTSLPPFIAVNTTAGTASELTRFCIITDVTRKVKMAIVDWRITPSVTINDPLLMTGKPPFLTAATGMDALTHAIEAYVSTKATPITDACAEKAISMITTNLPMAVANGGNITARKNMAYAQYLAGMAFNSAGLGYVHAMAHQLGGFYDLPHGVCNALLLPAVEQYNLIANLKRFKHIAFLMGKPVKKYSTRDAAEQAIIAIKQLSQDLGIPNTLTELAKKYSKTIHEKDIPLMVINTQKDICRLTNPRKLTDEDVQTIYKSIW